MLAKHIGLFHGTLDEYLMDADFVAQKRNLYHAKQEVVASPPQVYCLRCFHGATELEETLCRAFHS